jgi:uncharacterized membrane protein YhaH (DUF805 family)
MNRQRRNQTMSVWEILSSFHGRIPRKTFWIASICLTVPVGIVAAMIDIVTGYEEVDQVGPGDFFALLFILPILAIDIKRLHDRNRSGWFILINFVPVVGSIWFLIEVGLLAGTDGPNRYGEDPLAI